LSKKWITGILRNRIRYNGFIVSDDMEMGAVLEFAPIEQTVVQHIRAGGDLALICHREELIARAYEALIREAERDRKFASRVAEAVKRGQTLRRKFRGVFLKRKGPSPSPLKTESLSRQLWEFGEEIRLATFVRADNKKNKKKERA
jgi:beta-N-acetylhexosaminidase